MPWARSRPYATLLDARWRDHLTTLLATELVGSGVARQIRMENCRSAQGAELEVVGLRSLGRGVPFHTMSPRPRCYEGTTGMSVVSIPSTVLRVSSCWVHDPFMVKKNLSAKAGRGPRF
jgi:hypothetical protein